MTGNPRGFTALAADQIDSQGRQWIEVMPTADKARNGSWYFTITADDLAAYATYIEANPDKIPVDYDHATDGSTRAAGWFTGQADVRDTDRGPILYAEVQWTPAALQQIRDGEFRFISPEWTMQDRDAKTGLLTKAKELVAATLTNRHFFKELAAVASVQELEDLIAKAATTDGQSVMFDQGDMATLQALDDLLDEILGEPEPEDAAAASVRERCIKALTDIVRGAVDPEGNEPDHEEGKEDDMAPVDYLKALGLDETSDDAVKIAKALNQKDEQILGLQAEITDLKAVNAEQAKLNDRIAELEQRDRKRDVEVLLAKAVETGRVLPAEKDTLTELFADNVNGLKTLMASRPAGFYGGYSRKEIGSGAGNGNAWDDPDTAAVARELGVKSDSEIPVDNDSARLHLRAMAILREQGKDRNYDSEDYATALDEALISL